MGTQQGGMSASGSDGGAGVREVCSFDVSFPVKVHCSHLTPPPPAFTFHLSSLWR